MQYLVLYLQGPLQAWGADSKFDLRETLPYPTKSGIYGMLLAASGDSGPQRELLAKMGNFPFSVFSFKNKIGDSKKLRDYHVVGNGFDTGEKAPSKRNTTLIFSLSQATEIWWKEYFTWKKQMIPQRFDHQGRSAKLTYRYYLLDKTFAVLLEFPDDLADKFASALVDPVYDLYLGRKCCAPTALIFQGKFASEAEAMQKIRALAERDELTPVMRIRETDSQQPDSILLNDVPVAFGPHKVYRDRWVVEEPFCWNQ